MAKPIILGLCPNNPKDKSKALSYNTPGSAGHRLFSISGMSSSEY